MNLKKTAKDVAEESLSSSLPIDYVGISDLQIPIRINKETTVEACVSVFVSLDKAHRGIHMSRIYLALHEFFKKNQLSFENLEKSLLQIINEQGALSDSGKLQISFNLPVQKPTLKSSFSGWRYYPLSFEVSFKNQSWQRILSGDITYSSTCPCSAALSQELIKDAFLKQFPDKKELNHKELVSWLETKQSLAATPHAQKSSLKFELFLDEKTSRDPSPSSVIEMMERALGTPVQTAVKREDEAEFARLNASNLMFCEDAVRKVASALDSESKFKNYFLRARHYESLHPFTVQSTLVKGDAKTWRA